MIFNDGFPKDNGASDWMDSARLAGMMALFNHPDMSREKLAQYAVNDGFEAVRCPVDPTGNPSNNPKNFTRDQLIPLIAGMSKMDLPVICIRLYAAAQDRKYRAQNIESDVPGSVKKFPDGADLLTPSHMNHLRMCAGQGSSLLGKAWLIMDIMFNGLFSPMSEPNQIMAMCKIAGPFYVKLLRKVNKKLDAAIREYWSGWRGESEFAEFLIQNFK